MFLFKLRVSERVEVSAYARRVLKLLKAGTFLASLVATHLSIRVSVVGFCVSCPTSVLARAVLSPLLSRTFSLKLPISIATAVDAVIERASRNVR